MKRPWIILFLMVLFSGCIQQDVRIVLHSDGSGEYSIKRNMSRMENALVANMSPELREKALTEQQEIRLDYPGGLKRTLYSVAAVGTAGQFNETSVYSFSNLGEALPALENLIPMGPRYAYRNGRFVIFRDREQEQWDGVTSDDTKDDYLNLTLDLPAEPESSNGKVEGTTVHWAFNTGDLKKFQGLEMGDNLIQASIPAAAIKVDLKPRLVDEVRNSSKNREAGPLELFSARFPIMESVVNEPPKADLQVVFPIGDLTLPVSYRNLHVESMVVDGQGVKPELKSETSGSFNGKDQWGQEKSGFPLSVAFPVIDPWISRIDRLQIGMDVNVVQKTRRNVVEVPAVGFPAKVALKEDNPLLVDLSVVSLDKKASGFLGGGGIILLTSAAPESIAAFYLDTDYGLEYKANQITTKIMKPDDFWDAKIKAFVHDSFPEGKIYQYQIGFSKIPRPPFTLIIETVDKADYQSKTLTLENIDVSP